MGYIAQWDDFSVSAERMFLSSPLQTRISLKYRATDGVFVVKVTDNQKVRAPLTLLARFLPPYAHAVLTSHHSAGLTVQK